MGFFDWLFGKSANDLATKVQEPAVKDKELFAKMEVVREQHHQQSMKSITLSPKVFPEHTLVGKTPENLDIDLMFKRLGDNIPATLDNCLRVYFAGHDLTTMQKRIYKTLDMSYEEAVAKAEAFKDFSNKEKAEDWPSFGYLYSSKGLVRLEYAGRFELYEVRTDLNDINAINFKKYEVADSKFEERFKNFLEEQKANKTFNKAYVTAQIPSGKLTLDAPVETLMGLMAGLAFPQQMTNFKSAEAWQLRRQLSIVLETINYLEIKTDHDKVKDIFLSMLKINQGFLETWLEDPTVFPHQCFSSFRPSYREYEIDQITAVYTSYIENNQPKLKLMALFFAKDLEIFRGDLFSALTKHNYPSE